MATLTWHGTIIKYWRYHLCNLCCRSIRPAFLRGICAKTKSIHYNKHLHNDEWMRKAVKDHLQLHSTREAHKRPNSVRLAIEFQVYVSVHVSPMCIYVSWACTLSLSRPSSSSLSSYFYLELSPDTTISRLLTLRYRRQNKIVRRVYPDIHCRLCEGNRGSAHVGGRVNR